MTGWKKVVEVWKCQKTSPDNICDNLKRETPSPFGEGTTFQKQKEKNVGFNLEVSIIFRILPLPSFVKTSAGTKRLFSLVLYLLEKNV